MAKILAIDGRVRAANGRLITDARGAPCCCPAERRYRIFYNCCDLGSSTPLMAMAPAVFDHITATCQPVPDLVVRVVGQRACYTPGTATASVTREDAVARNLLIVENIAQVQCVPTRDDLPVDQCYTESCPECPQDCCLTDYFRHDCPDIQYVVLANGVPDPKRNRCCVYGREAEVIWSHDVRTTEEQYTSFQYGEATNGCPPGCYDNLLAFRRNSQVTERYVNRFRACEPDGTNPIRFVDCISGERYVRLALLTRRRDDPNNCLGYVDDVNDQESRSSDCWTNFAEGYPLPPIELFPSRPCRQLVRNYDGTTYFAITESCGGDPPTPDTVCEPFTGFYGVQRQQLDRNAYTETEYVTTFRYGVDCFSGSYVFDQRATTKQYGLGCPRDGALLATYHIIRTASYSIRTTASDGCDRSICDGFRTATPTAPFPFPSPPSPVLGGLELL